MCGITGIFDFRTTEPIDRALLHSMNTAIAHRGPDGEGFFVEPGIGMGNRRLAIIDVAHGDQPIFNEDGTVAVVFNGEIYNFRELIAELTAARHKFRTHSDTEVLVHAWEQWGADCVQHLRGMFAFAIFDRNSHTLFLARDRLGKKPLYYALVAGRYCVFASELKALLVHPLIEKRLNLSAVDDYLAFGYVPDPDTIYEGVAKLPPSHSITLVRGREPATPVDYWRLRLRGVPADEQTVARELMLRLEEAVRIRLVSEVPLGAFLSGGVDSSGIVALMARLLDAPIKTFSIGLGNQGADELAHAERIADRYHTNHHAQQIDSAPLSAYRAQAAIFDEPFADSSSIPTLQVSKLARQYVTVVLSGDGGDELFAGYRRYRMHALMESWRKVLPSGLRRGVFGSLGRIYPKLDRAPRWLRAKYTLQELALDTAAAYFRTVARVHDDMRFLLYTDTMRRNLDGHHPAERIAEIMREADTDDQIVCAQYADIATYLPGDILTKVDRTSMAASLEVRVPMLDHEFVEWTASVATDQKLRGGQGKYILKKAFEELVPHENLYRPKQGFATSLASSFRGEGAAGARAALLGPAMTDIGLFNMQIIEKLIGEHERGLYDHSQILWSLLMFEGFLTEVHFSDQAARGVASASLSGRREHSISSPIG